MSNKGVFLDVDSTIVESNLRFVNDSNEEELNKLFSGTDNYPSKLVKPSPGFCVKTKEIGTDAKLFINVCHTDAIPPPRDISEEELIELLDQDVVNYKVPMSIGNMRMEKDKKGENAKTCDVAINTNFFEKVKNNAVFKNFFISVASQGVENKYNLVCTDEKIILANRKAFGTLQMHRIRQDEIKEKMSEPKSLIQEITKNDGEQKKVVIETIASVDNETSTREPEFVLFKRKDSPNCLIGEFKFPDVISPNEITVDIGEDRIFIESIKHKYLLDLFVPHYIRQQNSSATFEKTTKVLTVTMPLMGG